jgi:hypothetical protein
MSWLFSRALVEEFLADTCSDGAPSAQLNGTPMRQAYLCSDKMTEFLRLSRFGMTCERLTVSLGEELLASYREDFLVRTSPSQVKGGGYDTVREVDSGRKWYALLAMYDHVTHSLKIPQHSLFEDWMMSLRTLPRSGMMRNGLVWGRKTLEHLTAVNGSGYWPTPTVSGNYNRRGASANSGDGLATAVRRWPTPTAHNAKETNAPSESLRHTPTLAAQVGGKLNPTWVEWLMGWPIGWTDLQPLATGRFQQWLQQHFSHCTNEYTD